jgi:methyl-accepting chemotaxis protein
VRALARRSAEAAKQIRAVIGDSATDVASGARLVHEAGEIIGDIAGKAEEVNELIGIIAIASREQASGVDGINGALSQLQGSTQANAAAVQSAAHAATQLREEAGRLLELVRRFRTDEPEAAARSPSAQRLAGRGRPRLSG